jgi:hypothetical protein
MGRCCATAWAADATRAATASAVTITKRSAAKLPRRSLTQVLIIMPLVAVS